MKTYFKSGKALKFTEEDVYKEGCLPETGTSYEVDVVFTAETKEELIKKMKDFYDVDNDSVLLNSCEENGRVDICILEDGESSKANDRQVKEWKKGKIKLYNSIYSYIVTKITEEDVVF